MIKKTEIRDLRTVLRVFERELAFQLSVQGSCCGVTMEQCHTILELGNAKKEINLKTLAERLDLEKSTVSRGVDSLVKSDLIIRKPDEKNRRFVSLSLSEKGKFTYDTINNNCDTYYKKIFDNIPSKKHSQVIESFTLFADAILTLKKYNTGDCSTQCINQNGE